MYAVVRTGGKQYRVEPGMVLDIEKVPGEVGDPVELPEVLLLADGEDIKVGQPLIDGVSVQGEIVAQKKGRKIVVFKKIRRQGKRVTKGHRQNVTRIRVKEISAAQ